MKRIYIPIIALVVGFANACLAFQVHSMLFCLLPLLAFTFGYFSSSWKTGLLSSFLLFISYTTATAFMRVPVSCFDPIDYLFNFVYGGFVLCIIGCGASTVKPIRALPIAQQEAMALVELSLLGVQRGMTF